MTHFNPLPPRRERQDQAYIVYAWINFNPLPPRRGRQWRWRIFKSRMMISIHSLLAEGDVHACKSTYQQYPFQSTPSSQRETCIFMKYCNLLWFQSTPSSQRETSKTISIPSFKRFQSTPSSQRETVYPHKLRKTLGIFQSTPSSQRETAARLQQMGLSADFNPLPPRRGRHAETGEPMCMSAISIHSLLAEGDGICGRGEITLDISIHSLLAEGDCQALHGLHAGSHFNPLPPRRGRLAIGNHQSICQRFQSTPSSQRETPRIEKEWCWWTNFNPLPPRRGRHQGLKRSDAGGQISIHSLLAEGDGLYISRIKVIRWFQSTPSSQRETVIFTKYKRYVIFQSTPSSQRETFDVLQVSPIQKFQSTPSSQRETQNQSVKDLVAVFQSTPSSQRETTRHMRGCSTGQGISIHSLLAEGDPVFPCTGSGVHISIHSLLAEGDQCFITITPVSNDFNPLPPRRGRHMNSDTCYYTKIFQSTPSSQRETGICSRGAITLDISIHSLLAEGDVFAYGPRLPRTDFNPLPPRRGRLSSKFIITFFLNFNPLPPRRGRRFSLYHFANHWIFQSTPSSQRETASIPPESLFLHISIHSLLAEGDEEDKIKKRPMIDFNPLPPRRGRRWINCQECISQYFNPLPPRRGRLFALLYECLWWHFNPLPPRRGRHALMETDIQS